MISTKQAGTTNISRSLADWRRSEEHTSELQSLMRISSAVFCLKKKTIKQVKNRVNITKKTQWRKKNRINCEHLERFAIDKRNRHNGNNTTIMTTQDTKVRSTMKNTSRYNMNIRTNKTS